MLSPTHALIVLTPGDDVPYANTGSTYPLRVFRTDGAQWLPVPTKLTALFEYAPTIAISPSGRYMAHMSRSTDDTITVYDIADWFQVGQFARPGGGASHFVAVSDDGLVALSTQDNHASAGDAMGVLVCDPRDADPLATAVVAVSPMAPPSGPGLFMPGGLFGVPTHSGFDVYDTADWSLADHAAIAAIPGAQVSARSADGAKIFLAGNNGIQAFDWDSGAAITLPTPPSGSVTSMAVNASGTMIYFVEGANESSVRVMDLVADENRQVFTTSDDVGYLTLSPDGSKLAVFYDSGGGGLRIHDADTGAQDAQIPMSGGLNWGAYMAWTPMASLKEVSGTVRDAADAPAVRDVRLLSRGDDSLDMRTQSGEDGAYRFYCAAPAGQVNRIVYDSTGEYNDLIDRVEL